MYAMKGCPDPVVPIDTEELLARIPPCLGKSMVITNRIEYD
jgi:hypothetical protein